MLVSELLSKAAVKDRLSDTLDTGYEDNELLAYLNDAINVIWNFLISSNYYECIGDITFTVSSTELPSDWYKVTNQAPIIINGSTATVYGVLPLTVRYYKRAPQLTALTDTMPFKNDAISNIAAQLLVVLAMTNHGYNMDTERDIAQTTLSLM